MRGIHERLNDDWFNNASEDEDDLEGILDYLEQRSYDGFIDLDDEAYNMRRCKLLGITYKEPTPILIEKVKVTKYTIGPDEIYMKVKVLGVDEIPRTRDNVAIVLSIRKWNSRDQVSILGKDKGFGQEMQSSRLKMIYPSQRYSVTEATRLRRNITLALKIGSLRSKPLRDGWTDFLQEPSIPRISLKRSLFKGTAHHQGLLSSLKKSATSNRKETRHYTKLGNGAMNRQLLDSQGPIPGMTPAQALTVIQTMTDHSQKWHEGSSNKNIESSSNSKGIAAIVSKLENLGRDMKKLKENVHAIQVGYQICGGAHLNKDFPLNEEVKSVEEVKYGEFGRPFPNNRNDSRFNKGGYDQPSSGERRPSLTKTIKKYMKEASKRHAEQNELLKKVYQIEGRLNKGKFEECKTIYTEDGSPLYTPFYYSPEEIEYFSANSGFSDNETHETDNSGMAEALAALEAALKKKKEELKEENQSVNYYVDPMSPQYHSLDD
ncbi:hypothetical protein Tco_1514674 [Tanacetum coccineum]